MPNTSKAKTTGVFYFNPGIAINDINYKIDDIKCAIKNNDPIEEKLNVIAVISNPCLYKRRYKLLKEFEERMKQEDDVNLFIVELVYGNQEFAVTDKNNKNHLQIKTEVPIWHKENMINLGVKYLLPKTWKAFAWIDADIEFESTSWALDTLKILNGCKDVVQVFSHCVDMGKEKNTLNLYDSFGYNFSKNNNFSETIRGGKHFWHPGYAWAITRKAYEKIGGLYDIAVLGGGDSIMAHSFIGGWKKNKNIFGLPGDFSNKVIEFQQKTQSLRLGYTPGVIRHHYHGSKKNRKYGSRRSILTKHSFSPTKQLQYDDFGILIPTEEFSQSFKNAILKYFKERKEDD
jgi:hypothetical protein